MARAGVWMNPAVAAALRTGEVGPIVRAYRHATGLSQSRLADRLGYDTSFISMLETGRRSLQDVTSRRHVARVLSLPPHLLGVTDPADADHHAMVAFADSTVRLADVARAAGHATDAVNELWGLVGKLEQRAINGNAEPEVLEVLTRARTSLGVCLGTVLPEERLHVAVAWTRRGALAAQASGSDLQSWALQMYGNELRKIRRDAEAVRILGAAADAALDDDQRGAALALLTRAAGQAGDEGLFTAACHAVEGLLDRRGSVGASPLLHPYSWSEIKIRGLLDLGRPADARRLAARAADSADLPPTPQWSVIAGITMADVCLTAGNADEAEAQLLDALDGARRYGLPHQAQRGARLARRTRRSGVVERAVGVVEHLAVGQAAASTGSRCGGKT